MKSELQPFAKVSKNAASDPSINYQVSRRPVRSVAPLEARNPLTTKLAKNSDEVYSNMSPSEQEALRKFHEHQPQGKGTKIDPYRVEVKPNMEDYVLPGRPLKIDQSTPKEHMPAADLAYYKRVDPEGTKIWCQNNKVKY